MKVLKNINGQDIACVLPEDVPEEITEQDEANFFRVVSTDLTEEQAGRILAPAAEYPRQETVLAVHWHPEFVPMDMVSRRVRDTFPNCAESMIVPTQHNVIMSHGRYCGVEVDCFSEAFHQKVQLLIHFENERMLKADVLKSMIGYTFKYRSSQLYDFIDTIIEPNEERIERAARATGADPALINFVTAYVKKVSELLDKHRGKVPEIMIKNKILRNYFDAMRPMYGHSLINRAQAFLTAVKKVVKSEFPLDYFYRTSEIIEEARSIGAGIVIPHPEQFWPILLAEYDVDGYEVWNPQSSQYTDFLISVVDKKNKSAGPSRRRILVFMGDDTHMGEKVKDPEEQDLAKASREIGVQPPWDDLIIKKKLIMAGMSRREVIAEYKDRLAV